MIENTQRKIIYQGEGEIIGFAVPFPVADLGDISALVLGPDNSRRLLKKEEDFTIEKNSQGAISLMLTETFPQGHRICIFREQSPTQSISLVENARFPSSVIEEGLDRVVMVAQAHQENLSRTLQVPIEESPEPSQITLPIASKRPEKVLGWDADGAVCLYDHPHAAVKAAEAAKAAADLARDEALGSADAAKLYQDEAQAQSESAIIAKDEAVSALQATELLKEETMLARDEALEASELAWDAPAIWASSASYKGTWNAAAGIPSPYVRGNWWWITSAGTFGGITWAVGDAAIYNGTAWQKIPLDTLLTAEKQARIASDLSQRNWVDFPANVKGRIPALQTLSAPLTIAFDYDLPAQLSSDLVIFSQFGYRTNTGGSASFSLIGVQIKYTHSSNRIEFVVADGGSINSSGRSDVIIGLGNVKIFPQGKHTCVIRLFDEWRNGIVGQLKCDITFDDYTLFDPNMNYASASTFDFSNRGDGQAIPASFHVTGYHDSAASTSPLKISRFVISNRVWPMSAAEDTNALGYTVQGFLQGTLPPESITVIALDKVNGPQWRDSSSNRTHAVIETTPAQLQAPCTITDRMEWSYTTDTKAMLSATTAVIPPYSQARVSASFYNRFTSDGQSFAFTIGGHTVSATVPYRGGDADSGAASDVGLWVTGADAEQLTVKPMDGAETTDGILRLHVALSPLH